MKRFAIITIAMMAMLSLTTTLYAAGDMKMSSEKQHDGYSAVDMNKAGKLDGKTGIAKDDMSTGMQTHDAMLIPSAEELSGMKVVSIQGEEIGEIADVTKDEQTGKIKFVTISKGGILGIGDEEIPVPLEAFSFEEDQARLTVDTRKLDNAPQQADLTDEQFQRDLESHYGVSPAWDQGSGQDSALEGQQPQKMQSDDMKDPAKNEMD